jgi:hypothetical protein
VSSILFHFFHFFFFCKFVRGLCRRAGVFVCSRACCTCVCVCSVIALPRVFVHIVFRGGEITDLYFFFFCSFAVRVANQGTATVSGGSFPSLGIGVGQPRLDNVCLIDSAVPW